MADQVTRSSLRISICLAALLMGVTIFGSMLVNLNHSDQQQSRLNYLRAFNDIRDQLQITALNLYLVEGQKIAHQSRISSGPKNSLGKKILVVEDNGINQCVIGEILDEIGHDYRIAGDGQQAIDMLPIYKPDLILMDVSMPVMNGLEATAGIRKLDIESGQHTLIVGLTANALTADRIKCLE